MRRGEGVRWRRSGVTLHVWLEPLLLAAAAARTDLVHALQEGRQLVAHALDERMPHAQARVLALVGVGERLVCAAGQQLHHHGLAEHLLLQGEVHVEGVHLRVRQQPAERAEERRVRELQVREAQRRSLFE